MVFMSGDVVLVLDGAAGTALEDQGFKLHPQLWSAELVKTDEEAIKELHRSYFSAGANVVTSVTYQASIQGFVKHLGVTESEAFFLMTRAVILAKEVAIEAESPVLRMIAAGLGPYGAYLCQGQEYTGDYGTVDRQQLKNFHLPRISAVLAGDPDILLFETFPNKLELEVIAEILATLSTSIPVWISLSVKLDNSGFLTLADGTPITEVKKIIPHSVKAVGANCFPLVHTEEIVRNLASFDLPVIIYPNSGEVYDGKTKEWLAPVDSLGTWDIKKWVALGARVVGGCCRTSPESIRSVAEEVREINMASLSNK